MKIPRLYVVLLFAALSACKEISFREPQPKSKKTLDKFPKSIQGKYLGLEDDGTLSKDTVVVSEKNYRLGYFKVDGTTNSGDAFDSKELGDSLVLKSYKGYYFLNFNEKPEW